MPQPLKYASTAEKQKAYRARQADRLKAISEGRTPPPPAIGNMPATQRWNALHEQARSALEALRDEMQAYYDARTEQWQESDRGTDLLDRIEATESLLTDLDAIHSA